MRTLLLLNVFEPEEIGDRIKQARERAGLRQEDLADLIGMSTRQVQNYEAGESKQYAKLRAIASATGVAVEWLLRGEDADPAATPPGADEVAQRLLAVEEQLQALRRELQLRLPDAQAEPQPGS